MALKGRNAFLLVAVVFHLVYAWSIFDIYFVSPIVRGMRAHAVPDEAAPAKRLVLFVGEFWCSISIDMRLSMKGFC